MPEGGPISDDRARRDRAGSHRRADRRAPPAEASLLHEVARGHPDARGAAGVRAPVLRLRVGLPAAPLGAPHPHRGADVRQRSSTTCGTRSTARTTTPSCGCGSPRGSASRDEVRAAERNEGTKALVDIYWSAVTDGPIAAGVAALYAYEGQVPEVATEKIGGLASSTASTTRTLAFFTVHSTLDVEHSGAEREMIADLAPTEADEEAGSPRRSPRSTPGGASCRGERLARLARQERWGVAGRREGVALGARVHRCTALSLGTRHTPDPDPTLGVPTPRELRLSRHCPPGQH